MKKGLKMNPNVAKIADRIVAAAAATEARGKCSKPSVPNVELKPKYPLNLLMADLYIAWSVSKDKNKTLFN
jgi:hypothetical protein